MKKILTLIVLIIIAGLVIWKFNSSSVPTPKTVVEETVSIPTSQTISVSTKISEYKNDELGFSVKYPTVWVRTDSATSVVFSAKLDEAKNHTVGKLESQIDIIPGKCAFPPVTTVKERDTLKVGDLSFNMISISNTLQSKSYFNRMYSLQKDSICYFFTFSSISANPTSKGFTGADAKKVSAQNVAMIDAADTQFKDMVKSFKFVSAAVGQDETKVNPKK